MATSIITNSTYRDIDLSFVPSPFTGDIQTIYDDAAIRRAVQHIILTSYGEKPFQHLFGTDVQSLLFNQFSAGLQNILQTEIMNSLKVFEPRIAISSVKVTLNEDQQNIDVTISYVITGQDANFQSVIQLPLEG